MGIQEKDIKMKGSKIVVFFGGILLIGLCFGQPIQESQRVEDLTNRIVSSGLDRNDINWDGLNNFINQDSNEIVKMLDQDGNGQISSEDVVKDLEVFEGAIHMTPVEDLNKWIADKTSKFLDVTGHIA